MTKRKRTKGQTTICKTLHKTVGIKITQKTKDRATRTQLKRM